MRYRKGFTLATLRPNVFKRQANGMTYYNATVRGANAKRTYLGTTTDHGHALAICERFIATGERPPKGKRGPKGAHQGKPKAIILTPRKPEPKPEPPAPKPNPNNTAPGMTHKERVALLRRLWYRSA